MITCTHWHIRAASAQILFMTMLAAIAVAQPRWEQVRGPEGGEITAFGQAGEIILAATRNPQAIFRSGTNGDSWVRSVEHSTPYAEITSFASVGDTIYAGTYGGLSRSLNDGHTWSNVPGGSFSGPTHVAALNGVLLVASSDAAYTNASDGSLKPLTTPWPTNSWVHSAAVSNGAMFVGTGTGFFRSTDRGMTWHTVTLDSSAGYVMGLAATGDTILAVTSGTGIFRSFDNGGHWLRIAGSNQFDETISILGSTIFYPGPFNKWIARSTDAGTTWKTDYNAPRVHTIHITPGALFAATSDKTGILRSLDSGATWTAVNNGLVEAPAYVMLASGSDLLLGTRIGLFRLDGADDSLQPMTEPTEITHLARLGDEIICAFQYGFARWSARRGTWIYEKIEPGTDIVTALAAIDDMLYIAAHGTIYRGINTSVGLRYVRTEIDSVTITSIASDGVAVIATDGSKVWRTIDSGRSWRQPYTPQESPLPPEASIRQVVFVNGMFHALTTKGIYTSADGNLPWSHPSSDLDFRIVSSLAYADSVLYAGTDAGIYRSLDNGRSWSGFNDGFAGSAVAKLARVGKRLYASTYEGPISRIQVSTLSTSDERGAMDAALLAITPNPAAAATTIRYTIGRRGHAALSLFDPLGRRLRALVDEEVEAGAHELRLDAAGLPSGMYYIRLEAGGMVIARAVAIGR